MINVIKKKIAKLFESRKFVLAVSTILAILLDDFGHIEISEAAMSNIITMASMWIGGQSLVDVMAVYKEQKKQ